eukprot:Skav214373  [mRNA]  locus=scaffold822:134423:147931:+ [translate_table: standard]
MRSAGKLGEVAKFGLRVGFGTADAAVAFAKAFAIECVHEFLSMRAAVAWYRIATAVEGSVVKEAGNLTMGGKVGTYTVLLQVLNPPAGDLDLLIECCGDARSLAQEASNAINTNTGGPTEQVKAQYVGEGKCSEPGPLELLAKQGNPECSYLYSFKNKNLSCRVDDPGDWAKLPETAFCVPDDVCSVDVAGATKGLARSGAQS